MTMRYPVLLTELPDSHPQYQHGRHFAVEQVDKDTNTFATLADAQAFMHEHDLVAITPEDMAAMRSHQAANE